MSAFPRARPLGQQQRSQPSPVVHGFTASGDVNHRGESICTCGSLFSARVHRLKERTEEEAEHEARRLGESTPESVETQQG